LAIDVDFAREISFFAQAIPGVLSRLEVLAFDGADLIASSIVQV